MRIILHGKDLAVPEMTGPMSAAVLKGALNHLLTPRSQQQWGPGSTFSCRVRVVK